MRRLMAPLVTAALSVDARASRSEPMTYRAPKIGFEVKLPEFRRAAAIFTRVLATSRQQQATRTINVTIPAAISVPSRLSGTFVRSSGTFSPSVSGARGGSGGSNGGGGVSGGGGGMASSMVGTSSTMMPSCLEAAVAEWRVVRSFLCAEATVAEGATMVAVIRREAAARLIVTADVSTPAMVANFCCKLDLSLSE